MTAARPIVVMAGAAGGSNAGGILLLLVGVLGLAALFSGNLDRVLNAIGGQSGGPAGFSPAGNAGAAPGAFYPSPAPNQAPSNLSGPFPKAPTGGAGGTGTRGSVTPV